MDVFANANASTVSLDVSILFARNSRNASTPRFTEFFCDGGPTPREEPSTSAVFLRFFPCCWCRYAVFHLLLYTISSSSSRVAEYFRMTVGTFRKMNGVFFGPVFDRPVSFHIEERAPKARTERRIERVHVRGMQTECDRDAGSAPEAAR